MRSRFGWVVVATILAAGVVNPALADPGRVRVFGTVSDVLGSALNGCISVRNALVGSSLDAMLNPQTQTQADEEGHWELSLAPGSYSVSAWMPIAASGGGAPSCAIASDPSPYAKNTRTQFVEVVGEEQVDITIPFRMNAWVAGLPSEWSNTNYSYAIGDAVQPGAEIAPQALVVKAAGEAIRVVFRNYDGSTVDLSSRSQAAYADYWLYEAPAPVRAPLADGTYPYAMWAQDTSGNVLTDVASGRYSVDSVKPWIRASYPAEGDGDVPTTLTPWLDAFDNRGIGTGRIWLYRVSGSGEELVGCSARYLYRTPSDGRMRPNSPYQLEPNSSYRAEFQVSDRAGNTESLTISFTTGA